MSYLCLARHNDSLGSYNWIFNESFTLIEESSKDIIGALHKKENPHLIEGFLLGIYMYDILL